VSAHRYRIRVMGRVGAAAADPFDGLEVTQQGGYSEIRGLLDQTGLFGVLQRIQVFAFELVDVQRED
jgi:hypothetical protein